MTRPDWEAVDRLRIRVRESIILYTLVLQQGARHG